MLRFYHVLFVLAGVLFFGSFALVDNGVDLRTSFQGEETFGIPAGANWYYAVELPMQAGGRIHIEFEETSERAIKVLLLPERDFQAFVSAEAILGALGTTSGSSGALALNLRDAGTFFLVFTHASETQGVLQEVQLRYSFTGVQPAEPDWLLVGVGAVTLGFGAVVVSMAAMRRLRVYRLNEAKAAA